MNQPDYQQAITNKLGIIKYQPQDIITFHKGLLGFEEYQKYLLIKNDENDFFYFLQSLEESSLMFILINPKHFFADYELDIRESDLTPLKIDNLVDFCIATIPTDINKATINLLGPLIIDVKQQIGKQVISLNGDYSTKHDLLLNKKEIAI